MSANGGTSSGGNPQQDLFVQNLAIDVACRWMFPWYGVEVGDSYGGKINTNATGTITLNRGNIWVVL